MDERCLAWVEDRQKKALRVDDGMCATEQQMRE
jgi:hypothetical protein